MKRLPRTYAVVRHCPGMIDDETTFFTSVPWQVGAPYGTPADKVWETVHPVYVDMDEHITTFPEQAEVDSKQALWNDEVWG